jgi:class 3 adenylate cyclase
MPRYCMFGDTVNVANRMESSGSPERIHLSCDTYERLINPDQYIFEDRGEITVKGKGLMRTYFLLDRKPIQIVSKSRSNTLSRPERQSL